MSVSQSSNNASALFLRLSARCRVARVLQSVVGELIADNVDSRLFEREYCCACRLTLSPMLVKSRRHVEIVHVLRFAKRDFNIFRFFLFFFLSIGISIYFVHVHYIQARSMHEKVYNSI